MPRGIGYTTEKEAMEIVRAEEIARGWTPGPVLGQRAQAQEGCDFFSTPPDGGPAHPVEVKGWGEPILDADGRVLDAADITVEQLSRAEADTSWRLEIVANLAAARSGAEKPQRLSLSAEDVCRSARPWRFRVDLTGFAGRVRQGGRRR